MKLTKDTVKKVAKLAILPITDDEEEVYTTQLSGILDYIELLDKAETKDTQPTFNITGLVNVMREDSVSESLSSDKALQNANSKQGLFVTKGIFEDE